MLKETPQPNRSTFTTQPIRPDIESWEERSGEIDRDGEISRERVRCREIKREIERDVERER